MIHLSVRLAWHDRGWDGHICNAPRLNTSCVVHDYIRVAREDDKEAAVAGKHIAQLKGWRPPCARDIGPWSPRGYATVHHDPLERNFLEDVPEEIPAYANTPSPYRWLREENFREVCDAELLTLRGPDRAEKTHGWVQEPDRQKVLLETFWSNLEPKRSLVFYYLRPGVPLDEDARRVIVGVGRIASVGPQVYFGNNKPDGEPYPIWSRAITQNYPDEGFRLPYQEYLAAGHDPSNIVCRLPNGLIPYFSFVAEHVTDDAAVGVLERLLQSVEAVRQEAKVAGDWDRHLDWLNDALAEVWQGRGPYPGIGSVLQYLGCARGTAYQRLELSKLTKTGDNPWLHVKEVLEGGKPLNATYKAAFEKAAKKWNALPQSRRDLLATLARFELTPDQIRRVSNPDERAKAGIAAVDADIIANPYLLCEQDLGTDESTPIALDIVDHGMRPEGAAAQFIPPEAIAAQDDERRVRAVAIDTLRQAADAGDTVLTFDTLMARIPERFPDRRACRPDRDVVQAQADFYGEELWLALDNDPQLVALKELRSHEQLIAERVQRRVKRTNEAAAPAIDWKAALEAEFGEPKTERERAALTEKETALETLFTQRLSVLTGSAGTGKTSLLKVFLDQIGKQSVLLLAPTGKARVRLSTKARRNAMTIHQLLLKKEWLMPELFALKLDGGKQDSATTVIVDECSMIPTDLFSTMLKALDLNKVARLILVGDPNQLPPIGPGRPFVDIIEWLRANAPQCIASLKVTMRIADESEAGLGQSTALAFADGYRNDNINPADDELLAQLARGESAGDLEIHFWEDQADLRRVLKASLARHLELDLDAAQADYPTLNRSFGVGDKPWAQTDFSLAERWQLLSPVHGQPHGTDELNRLVQLTYKKGLILKSRPFWSKQPRPFGEQEIVYTDKVIQIVNRRMRGYPYETGLDYVANGEIGIVKSTKKADNGDYLDVGFSTQPNVSYRYYRSMVDENLELAYALTVHKAQGSDFDIVFLIVPKEAPTLCRELIYTGLTRFRKRLVLLVEKDVSPLEALRRPDRSDTFRRNTQLFALSLRADDVTRPFAENLIHRTATGVMVRSKSEVIVADTLTRLSISYDYELRLPSRDNPKDFRLPDFTVGYEGDVYYWEHLGMLSIPAYREAWQRKEKWYKDNGYFDRLIVSQDGSDGSIDAADIEHIARRRILQE
jgi:ATP-dependent exoDNAse (exonuclease V) alpha subunit